MIDCAQIRQIAGIECRPVRTTDGSSVFAVVTPYHFSSGRNLSFYVEEDYAGLRLFDLGWTLGHLSSMGLNLSSRRRWRPIRERLEPFRVELDDDGCIEARGPMAVAHDVYRRYTEAMLSVIGWEREASEHPATLILADEVEFLLRAWRPTRELKLNPQRKGISGAAHTFNFQLGDQLVDAIRCHPNSTASALRKIVDVQLGARNGEPPSVLVVVDDRGAAQEHARAEREIEIIASHADVLAMTTLQRNVELRPAHLS